MAPDQAFLNFRRTGSPDALGLVFDATAPQLLLIAARLAPTGVSPEDLVQQTFVIAIEKAASYDEDQPLSRWLAGILAKNALAARRRSRRALDIDRLPARHLAGPAEEVEMRERVEVIQEAVAGMTVEYRAVLHLHLLHGLTVSEIAQALERPFRTTQSQLRRGLEILRRALPSGIGFAITAQASGLAQARTEVLRVAGAKGSAAGAVVGTSGLSAHWFAVGLVVSALGVGVAATVSDTWMAAIPLDASVDAVASSPLSDDRTWASNASLVPLRRTLIRRQHPESRLYRERLRVADGRDDDPVQETKRSVLDLIVVDDASGDPIEDFAIVCFRVVREQRGMIRGDQAPRYAGVHRGGTQRIEKLHRGENMLLVLPAVGSGYSPSGYVPVQVRGPKEKLTVRLHKTIPVPVRVVDGAGRPIVGTRVQLLQKLEKDPDPRIAHRIHLRFGSSHWSNYLELAVATTGKDGIANVAWQPWDQSSRLRATGPDHITTEVDAPSIRKDMPTFTLRVPRGATLSGRAMSATRIKEFALNLEGKRMLFVHANLDPRIVLRDARTGALHEGRDGKGYPIAPDGKFLWDGLPAGRWQLLFRYNKPTTGSRGGHQQTMPQILAEVALGSSGEKRVDVDLAPLLPTAVHGRVFLHGVELQPDYLGFNASWPDVTGKEKSFRGVHLNSGFKRAGGGYRLRGLPPGNHTFAISVRGTDAKMRTFHTFDRVRLVAGEDRALDLHFQHRVARIRLVRPDRTTPVGGRVVRVGSQHSDILRTDADGWITIDPVRARTIRVETYESGLELDTVRAFRYDDPRSRRTRIGDVTVDLARKVSDYNLIVPEGR